MGHYSPIYYAPGFPAFFPSVVPAKTTTTEGNCKEMAKRPFFHKQINKIKVYTPSGGKGTNYQGPNGTICSQFM